MRKRRSPFAYPSLFLIGYANTRKETELTYHLISPGLLVSCGGGGGHVFKINLTMNEATLGLCFIHTLNHIKPTLVDNKLSSQVDFQVDMTK